jgi:1-acyl-sn-glycerol-3-phosphate acyltransferase
MSEKIIEQQSFEFLDGYTYTPARLDELPRKKRTAQFVRFIGSNLLRPNITYDPGAREFLRGYDEPVIYAFTHGTYLADIAVAVHFLDHVGRLERFGAFLAMSELSMGLPGKVLNGAQAVIPVVRKPKDDKLPLETKAKANVDPACLKTLGVGLDLGIFPEGKNSNNGKLVLPTIYNGTAKYSLLTSLPVTVVGTAGLRALGDFGNSTGLGGTFRPVAMQISAPIYPGEMTEQALTGLIRETMQEKLDQAALNAYGTNSQM